jgi:hypothetical protein
MSNKSDCVLKNGYRRDSFDRFCDDLCEEILQYLSLKDKIRFECVSKQFKRNVYQRQCVLDFGYYCKMKIRLIEIVIKKFNKINTIHFNELCYVYDYVYDYEKLLRIIADNCNNLKSITISSYLNRNVSYNAMQYFFEKCGKNLKCIVMYNYGEIIKYNTLLRFCPNLMVIKGINIGNLIYNKNEDNLQLMPKLCDIDTYGWNLNIQGMYKIKCSEFNSL